MTIPAVSGERVSSPNPPPGSTTTESEVPLKAGLEEQDLDSDYDSEDEHLIIVDEPQEETAAAAAAAVEDAVVAPAPPSTDITEVEAEVVAPKVEKPAQKIWSPVQELTVKKESPCVTPTAAWASADLQQQTPVCPSAQSFTPIQQADIPYYPLREDLREEVPREKSPSQLRKLFSPAQRSTLKNYFLKTQYPTKEEYGQLAAEVQLSERSVKLWFQNNRARHRKRGAFPVTPAPAMPYSSPFGDLRATPICAPPSQSPVGSSTPLSRPVPEPSPSSSSSSSSSSSGSPRASPNFVMPQIKREPRGPSVPAEQTSYQTMDQMTLPPDHPFCNLHLTAGGSRRRKNKRRHSGEDSDNHVHTPTAKRPAVADRAGVSPTQPPPAGMPFYPYMPPHMFGNPINSAFDRLFAGHPAAQKDTSKPAGDAPLDLTKKKSTEKVSKNSDSRSKSSKPVAGALPGMVPPFGGMGMFGLGGAMPSMAGAPWYPMMPFPGYAPPPQPISYFGNFTLAPSSAFPQMS